MPPPNEPNQSTGQLKALLRKPMFWLIALIVFLLSWASASGGEDAINGAVWLFGGVILYFLPALIARKKPNANSVFVINLFFGWTVIGWVIALSMAVSNPQVVQIVQSPAISQAAAALHTGRVCPFCAEQIQPAAIVCKHCGRDLPAASV